MKYSFPKIEHIDNIRAAIEGRPEFIIAKRDGYTIVNYMVAMHDTFPPVDNECAAIRRELRGIIFNDAGYVIARRLHKFFNVNEREETLIQHIDFSQPHLILEKLDGSMITPFEVDSRIRWGTKMGLTDVAKPVEQFIAKHPTYQEFADLHMDRDQTPIFEWCSGQQRIVVDYPNDRLVLIAIRNNVSGEYKSYAQMKTYAEAYDIDIVKTYPGNAESMQHLIDDVRNREGIEGYVLRFDDGHMIKVKGDWYVRIHKVKDAISLEKNVIDLIVNEKLDDAKPLMLEEDRKRIEKFESEFWTGIDKTVTIYNNMFREFQVAYKDKREFAIECMPTLHSTTKTVMFAMWNGKDARSTVLDIVMRNVGSQVKIDGVREMWQDAKWNY